jgi:hypothetical protein
MLECGYGAGLEDVDFIFGAGPLDVLGVRRNGVQFGFDVSIAFFIIFNASLL